MYEWRMLIHKKPPPQIIRSSDEDCLFGRAKKVFRSLVCDLIDHLKSLTELVHFFFCPFTTSPPDTFPDAKSMRWGIWLPRLFLSCRSSPHKVSHSRRRLTVSTHPPCQMGSIREIISFESGRQPEELCEALEEQQYSSRTKSAETTVNNVPR